eukprot:TRINITY_DN19033_c0_g1_i1.p1 TRINITY_DN19033_c0_g1~~TRINITY_DN19033_c0_g1_i1.p1  ORF type:complete len:303 (-),score=46.49 TRINITY_DN19033_c0_g1_i1:473-1381(-)
MTDVGQPASMCPPSVATTPRILTIIFGVVAVLLAVANWLLTFLWTDRYIGTDVSSSPHVYGLHWDDTQVKLWNYHPFFMVSGLASFNILGILSYRLLPLPKLIGKAIHAFLLTLSVSLACCALYAVVENHDTNDMLHVNTAHSWAGVAVLTGFFLQWLLGAVFAIPAIPDGVKSSALPFHVLLGVFTLIGGAACIISGLSEKTAYMGACRRTDSYTDLSTECRLIMSLALTVIFGIAATIAALLVPAIWAERGKVGPGGPASANQYGSFSANSTDSSPEEKSGLLEGERPPPPLEDASDDAA